jgi:hypothetical protein
LAEHAKINERTATLQGKSPARLPRTYKRLVPPAVGQRKMRENVDRPLCGSCKIVLPFPRRELGNPTLNVTDADGIRWTIQDNNMIGEKVRP